ncbi:MAG: hypothetical protein CME15_03905 [Gemmatimonadetes bacterium]|nr:hypothetical protein [Gemmatimonadota bacterium]
MGKWSDRLKLVNAWVDPPAKPTEAVSAGNDGLLAGASWVSEAPNGPAIDPIESLSMTQFAISGEYRKVHSRALDEIIVLAADNATLPDFGDTVVYRAAEARLLESLPSADIRGYHEVKVYFDGIIEKAVPNERRINGADLLGTERREE